MTTDTIGGRTAAFLFPRTNGEAVLHVGISLLIIMASVSSFAISTMFGALATCAITLIAAIVLPASIPMLIVCSFLYQNLMVAWFTPFIADDNTFDAMRGANFVILITAYGAFLAASFQYRLRFITALRPWLLWSMGLAGVICFYLALGAVHGVPKDAIVYFRNTITPIACFHVAVVAASLYAIDMRKSLLWLGAGIVVYGYLELTFTMDFLSLFHGDVYIERSIQKQIDIGVWEQTLEQTGFVLRNLQDVMTTTFFNTPLLADVFPKVFRIGGPNFHNVSYAYSLAVISVWLLFQGRWLLPLAALPLLLVIGSKGAMMLLIIALVVRIMAPRIGTRITLLGTVVVAVAWVALAIVFGIKSGDYHVLGLFAGLRDFLHDPLGQGLGLGGNLSSTSENINVNWDLAQATGAADVPVESAVGVMLYQMGVGGFVFFGFLMALGVAAFRQVTTKSDPDFLFAFVTVVIISANAVLQEEAFFSPLALGFCLLLSGLAFGSKWREDFAATR